MSAITGSGDPLTISLSASAASRSGTAGRTISQPASFSSWIWRSVALTSRVSVLVIVCTAIGAAPPMTTPPTLTGIALRRVTIALNDRAREAVRSEQSTRNLAGHQLAESLDQVVHGHEREGGAVEDRVFDGDQPHHAQADLALIRLGALRRNDVGERLTVRVDAADHDGRARRCVLDLSELVRRRDRPALHCAQPVAGLESGRGSRRPRYHPGDLAGIA